MSWIINLCDIINYQNTIVKLKFKNNISNYFIKNTGNVYRILINTKKYHVFAPMGRFQLELIKQDRNINILDGTTVENKGKKKKEFL